MARQPRIEYAGAYYHVMSRGDRREAIFLTDADRERYLETLGEVCERTGWSIHAWVLMDNHYHWLLETPEANLVEGMKWFQNTYTRRFNSRNRVWGHVFGGRYKSILVEAGDYYQTLVDYIHLNPVRASLVETSHAEDLLAYKWSSLSQCYMQPPSKRKGWMEVGTRLGVLPDQERVKDRKQYLRYLHGIALEEGAEAGKKMSPAQGGQSTLTRGWFWGSQEFREKLENLLKKPGVQKDQKSKTKPSKIKVPKHGLDEAQRLLREGLQAMEIGNNELSQRKGSYPSKVVIAYVIHAKTIASQTWIAENLAMKSAVNVSQQIGRLKRGEIKIGKIEKEWLESVKIST
ncbi:MAG: transposase [Verrucomicrobiota bacterium]